MKLIFEFHSRIRAVTKNGVVSEPGPHSVPVFLGDPIEDEVFGLPGGNYPKELKDDYKKMYMILIKLLFKPEEIVSLNNPTPQELNDYFRFVSNKG